jgi:hypothetical protein
MRIGDQFERIAYHGKATLAYLDEVYEREPVYKTFRSFYDSGPQFNRILLSSDGCRKSLNVNDAYDYDALKEVFTDIRRRGGSFEHQSRMKLDSQQKLDPAYLEVEWLKSLP